MQADFIVIGSGSAGSVLAARLSENGKHSVIVIEYGGSDWGPLIQMPGAISIPMNMTRYNWGYWSENETYLNNRRIVCPRGKVIGGSSSINGMVYVRGHPEDYNKWAEMGAKGWDYKNVANYFVKMENWHSQYEPVADIDAKWRGYKGNLHITPSNPQEILQKTFIKAGKQAGFQVTNDYNGYKQEGFSHVQRTIWKAKRCSTANAYLKPALKRKNLRLIRGLATKIIIENQRATGVKVSKNGKEQIIKANREVIIAAGSINSPQLLMLSGIGEAGHLREHDILVVMDKKAVGKNLQDHLELHIQYSCKQPISLYRYTGFFSKTLVGLRWLLFKTGPGASNYFNGLAFLRSASGVKYPDIQYHFFPIAASYDGKIVAGQHSFQAHVSPARSQSRGRIELRSKNPKDAPKVFFNYMSEEKDFTDFRYCIRLTRQIFAQKAFEGICGAEIKPGVSIQNDGELNDFIRQNVESAYHPCGTCRMGDKNDPEAVVDNKCKVIGIDNLRVADSSIFPQITNGNINAPSIMIGEKVSDYILNNTPPPLIEEEYWKSPNWQTSDR